ncbi:MAG: hypothetical protein HYU80_01725 [Candidatus Blackburnbacteria bacterium]|nr:hypothetical protein [Candidatus Blackburnbacteria bacterium]
MRYSDLFPKTRRNAPKEAESLNHRILVRGGFIDQLMSGSWTLLPLGFKVVQKVVDIIREEMNATGAQEVLMPLLHPKEIWNQTGRWETARDVMYQFKDSRDREYALSFTHEEVVMDLVRKHLRSYKDLPIKIYHFSTKFRNEPRARSGILRGREFLMKDLYSVHSNEEDMYKYYWEVKDAYLRSFGRIGFKDVKVVEAAGGVFTDKHTHEFQVLSEGGEDVVYYCDRCDWAQNKEIFQDKAGDSCPSCKKGKAVEARSIEVGNIFPLGVWYAEKMGVYFIDEDGRQKLPWFASYGIGPSRILGTLVEVYGTEKGMLWPDSVSPFTVHLININTDALFVYEQLQKVGIDVLYDDRDVSAGEKFADSDLIGIPIRLVVSKETGEKIEWKRRDTEEIEILGIEDVIERLKNK